MRVEWPTLFLIVLCYLVWAAGLFWLAGTSQLLAMVPVTLAIALQSSLQHEVIHGHPFPRWRNPNPGALLVYGPLNLAVPYERFRDQHLSHHNDSNLTDPYDDPESNFLDPAHWGRLGPMMQWLLNLNNTLLGRMVLGPLLGQISFMAEDWRLIRAGDRPVLRAWLLHGLSIVPIIWIVTLSPMNLWLYAICCYGGLGLLKIRTFLEHRAHEKARARTVIIEDRGLLSFLFLNNNFHVVHHLHPHTPWYRLPQLFARNREAYLERNDAYYYRNYAEIFRSYFLKAKDPVPHPLWQRDQAD